MPLDSTKKWKTERQKGGEELVTLQSLVASVKKEDDVAFGNYVSQALSFMDEHTPFRMLYLVGPIGHRWTHRDMLDNSRN